MSEFNTNTKKQLAQDFVRYVHEDLQQVKQPHFDIAFRLHEAKQLGYAELLGYDSIYDLSEKEFGFKRSSTKAYVAVCEQYMNNTQVGQRWTEYSFSQLVEMLSIQPWERSQIKPSMTIKDIRAWKLNRKTVKLPDGSLRMYGDLSPAQKQEYEKAQATPKVEVASGQTSGQLDEITEDLPEVITSNVEVSKAPLLSLKNKAEREAWLDKYQDWGVWLKVPQLDLKVYKYVFANGHSLCVSLSHFYNYMTYNKDKRCTLIRYHLMDDEVTFFDLSGISKTSVLDYLTKHSDEV